MKEMLGKKKKRNIDIERARIIKIFDRISSSYSGCAPCLTDGNTGSAGFRTYRTNYFRLITEFFQRRSSPLARGVDSTLMLLATFLLVTKIRFQRRKHFYDRIVDSR